MCFGLPIAHAHRLAEKGLAGEERGEWVVGLACVVMSILGLLLAALANRLHHPSGLVVPCVLAITALVTTGASTLLALAREARRRRFVAEVEGGKVAGYRVDPTAEGKVLVRVVSQGEGYRVADFEEEVFELGSEGEATRPKTLQVAPEA